MRKSVKRSIVVATSIATTAIAVAAFGSWLANGSGSAYAEAGTAKELVITEAQTTATLYPGVTGDSTIKIENPNPYAVRVDTITWKPSDGVQAAHVAGGSTCNNTGVYFGDFSTGPVGSNGVLSGLTLDLAAGETRTFTLEDSVRMINNSENGCQGAVFSIPVRITGESNA
jgi:hypothetical protein